MTRQEKTVRCAGPECQAWMFSWGKPCTLDGAIHWPLTGSCSLFPQGQTELITSVNIGKPEIEGIDKMSPQEAYRRLFPQS
jgi:hypothetical protein